MSLPENIDNCSRFCPIAVCDMVVEDARRKAIRKAVVNNCPGPIVSECISYEEGGACETDTERTVFHECGVDAGSQDLDDLLKKAHEIVGNEAAEDMTGVSRILSQDELRSHSNWDAHYLMLWGIQ